MSIDVLRDELAEVDRRILELVKRRQDVAESIGRLKSQGKLSIRNFAQEKEVLQRARSLAEELGVSAEVAEHLMKRLIRYSLATQERQRVAACGGGSGQRALVIGGSGRMGSWFSRFLASQGFAVEVADPRPAPGDFPRLADWRESALDQDFLVVAADLRSSAGILQEMVERRPPGVLFDIGSLKSPLRGPLEQLATAGVEVTSIHPMFGPQTELLSGRHVILVDLGLDDGGSSGDAARRP
jgi:chorismate mutase/prephenate dehydrogenase